MTRERRDDALLLTALTGAVYACPARLRPALALATAIGLSRAHGRTLKEYGATVERLFDERSSVRRDLDTPSSASARWSSRVSRCSSRSW